MGHVTNPATAAAGLKTDKPLQALLLGSVSLLACGIVLARAPAAYAQTINNNTTSQVSTNNGENLFVAPGVYIDAASHGTALINPQSNGVQVLSNLGTISGYVVDIHNAGSIGTLSNYGTLDIGFDGVANNGSIGTLSNIGTIIGGFFAIENQETIATVTNSGLLQGREGGVENTNFNTGSVASTIGLFVNTNVGTISGADGIINQGSDIGTLINAGLISGTNNGINNTAGGTIGQLTNNIGGNISNITNAGLIGGATPTAISNSGSIGTLSNSGTINGGGVGIFNLGTIGTVANSGSIIGGVSGIANVGTIGTIGSIDSLTNNNLIAGFVYGIFNSGTIGQVSNATGGTIAAYTSGLSNAGSIGTLTNNGLIRGVQYGLSNYGSLSNIGSLSNGAAGIITGGYSGIFNSAGIGTLTNAGTISGGRYGIWNYSGASNTGAVPANGVISTLTNAGMISSGFYAIYNDGGTIGQLINAAGAIITGVTSGIYNSGSIGTLTNSGTIGEGRYGISNYGPSGSIDSFVNGAGGLITGVTSAVYNTGSIGTLTNAGTITGGKQGIQNIQGNIGNFSGFIGQLSNGTNGLITGGISAIYNTGSIGTLTNAGTITGGEYGIRNTQGTIGTVSGFIGQLSNGTNGVITGGTAILNSNATIATLTNSGLISGANFGIETDNGTIGQLNNNIGAAITGGYAGIDNGGIIATLTNAGFINGNPYGIDNVGAFIGIISNSTSGTITAGSAAIFNNGGTIATITNSGLISGIGAYGINNDAGIGQLSNSTTGTITGGKTGIINEGGTIATLTNAGLIGGTLNNGIFNDYGGSIGSLTNSGVISAGGQGGITNFGTIGILNNTNLGTIIAEATGIDNNDFLGTLTNSGMVMATGSVENTQGIQNEGTILALTNSGTISGVNQHGYGDGITNSGGTIAALSNSGLINGGADGIRNINASIATLTNSTIGAITGGTIGIDNGDNINGDGTIATLTNAGSISGGQTGIYNELYSSIGTLTNAGLISGGAGVGIENRNYIDSLSNSGVILGGDGVADPGQIQTLTNTGTITGTSGDGLYIYHGIIGELDNTGLINGGMNGIENKGGEIDAINNGAGGTIASDGSYAFSSNSGSLGTLTNSGLIAGNINVFNQDFNIIGGAGTIFGTLTGGTIVLEAGDNLNLLSGNQIITDNVSGETDGGATSAIGTLTNSGILQIGYAGKPANISVDGNYTQTPSGTLNVIVTPAASSEMTITGNANLNGGVDYIFAPGTYAPKTYAYLTAGSITGTFTSENYGAAPASDVSTTYESDPTADLVIGSGFSLPEVFNPSDSAIFSDQTQALAEATQASDASLLGISATGGAAASPACEGQAALNPGATNGNNANIASAIAAELCNHGGWIQADGALGHVDGDAGAASYNANTAGFLAGIDSIFGPANTRLGFAIGYDETYLSDKEGGSGDMGTTRVALYGSQPLGPVLLSAVIGYGHAGNDTTRSTAVGGIKEKNDLGIVSGAVQASTALALQNLTLIPAAGIRFVNVESASFTEAPGANNAFALTGRTKNFNSVQPYATVELTTSYLTPSGMSIAPQATLGLQEEAGNLGAATNLYAADGTYFASTHTSTAPLAAILGAGLTATKSNLSFYINYNGLIAANWNTQSGTAGLRVSF